MAKSLSCMILTVMLFGAASTSPGRAEPRLAATILPVAAWVERIADEPVQTLVGPGQSHALYEPTTRDWIALGRCRLLFAVDVPFERVLLPKLRGTHAELRVVDLASGLQRVAFEGSSAHDDHAHLEGELDPHVWMSPRLARAMVARIAEELVGLWPAQEATLRGRARALDGELAALDLELTAALAPLRGATVFSFHPAFGYFARDYGLRMVAVESGGIESGPRSLARIVREARAADTKVLLVQPQFSLDRARSLAREVGLRAVVVDPMTDDLPATLRELTSILLESSTGRP